MFILVMGVTGSGKTTLGRALAARLGWDLIEGDDFHLPANIAKMRAGLALNDADRAPWLAAIAARMRDQGGRSAVICCSALKLRYRDVLRQEDAGLLLVYLQCDPRTSSARLRDRETHFMPGALVQSQFDALEEPIAAEHALRLQAAAPLAGNIAAVLAAFKA